MSANAVTFAFSDGIAVPLLMPVTPHGCGVGRWSSIARTVDAGEPGVRREGGARTTRSASEICGRMKTCVKGIALFSFVYSQRYDVALLAPVETLEPYAKPAR